MSESPAQTHLDTSCIIYIVVLPAVRGLSPARLRCSSQGFNLCLGSPGGTQYDEKNIRRRVYDALNVLIAMEIISRSKKEILWHGLPSGHGNVLERTRAEKIGLNAQIDKQQNYLQVHYLMGCSVCL